ncbi:MAG TPA: alpha/beta hydrolase [Candidatus Dormibacteraeota bacterium]|jgi:pimeloyl-ACP methyl ester carboxylesterase
MPDELTIEANGLRFRALAEGPADGAPVLLLHGFPEGAEAWGLQLSALAAAGFRAVAPDLRGYGGTDAPEGEAAYHAEPLMDDVSGLLDALQWERAHLAGHDWGALVGWAFAANRPQRLLTWTALSVGHPLAFYRAGAEDPDQQARSSYIKLFREAGKAEHVLAQDDHRRLRAMYRSGPHPDAIPDSVIDDYVRGFARPGRLTAALNYYRAALTELPKITGPVNVPTLLIWGDQDPAVGRRGTEATAALVEARYRLAELAGAGHWLQFERPREIAQEMVAHLQTDGHD